MLVSPKYYIDSILLFLIFLAYASVLPRIDGHFSPDRTQGSAIRPQYPSSRESYKSQHVSLRSTDAITRRDDDLIDALRIRRIIIVTGSIPIVPVAVAALSLERFYDTILSHTLAPWRSLPPQQALAINMGPLQLTMNVVYSNGIPQGIPWAFVRNFARNMLAMTALGFTGTYNMYYDTDDGSSPDRLLPNFGVDVRLRVLWRM